MHRDIHRQADIQTDTEKERERATEKASETLTLHCANRDVWIGKRNARFQSDLVTHLKLSKKLF